MFWKVDFKVCKLQKWGYRDSKKTHFFANSCFVLTYLIAFFCGLYTFLIKLLDAFN